MRSALPATAPTRFRKPTPAGLLPAVVPAMLLAALLGVLAPAAPAAAACGQPTGVGEEPTLIDCLHIAKASVGRGPCLPCECDINGSGSVRITDALQCLWFVVGAPVTLDCPPCSGSTTTTLPACAPCGQVLLGLGDPQDLCGEDLELYEAARSCPCSQCREDCGMLCPSLPPDAQALHFDQKACSTCFAERCDPLLRECLER